MLKNTTARERNQIKGERKNLEKKEKIRRKGKEIFGRVGEGGRASCEKTPQPAEKTKLRDKEKNWRKREKLEEKEIFGRIGKN